MRLFNVARKIISSSTKSQSLYRIYNECYPAFGSLFVLFLLSLLQFSLRIVSIFSYHCALHCLHSVIMRSDLYRGVSHYSDGMLNDWIDLNSSFRESKKIPSQLLQVVYHPAHHMIFHVSVPQNVLSSNFHLFVCFVFFSRDEKMPSVKKQKRLITWMILSRN